MKLSRIKVVLIPLLTVVGLLFLADLYPSLRFRGDGQFLGGPLFGYKIEMRKVPFYQTGEYTFHFRGLPDSMSLRIYVDGETPDKLTELRSLETTLAARFVDQDDHAACYGIGAPDDEHDHRVRWLTGGNDNLVAVLQNCVSVHVNPQLLTLSR